MNARKEVVSTLTPLPQATASDASLATARVNQPAAATQRSTVGSRSLLMFPIRIFLALGWLRATAEKAIDADWWSGVKILEFVAEHRETALIVGPLSDLFNRPVAAGIAMLVLAAEAIVGVCLLTGRKIRPALWVACALNVAFVMFGAVTPSAFYLVMQMTLILGLAMNRPQPDQSKTIASIVGWLVAAAAMTPFIRTLEPHAVIEDPAIMLATLAGLRAATLAIFAVEGAFFERALDLRDRVAAARR